MAIVTPAAVSPKMPSVRASSRMPSTISSSVTAPQRAAGLPDHVERVVAVGRVADRERLGDRVGPHRVHVVDAVGERRGDRRAAGGLRARHAHLGCLVEQADLVQLVEALVDLGEQRAARDRHDHVVGRLPAELLGGLVGERLRALGVERAHVHVHERPRVLGRELRAEAVDVVVVAVDGDDVAAVHRRW